MQTPCIEVSQLAPSTSFYASILQPLELRYLITESAAAGPGFAAFGSDHGLVLSLRQIAPPTNVRLSSIRLSAPYPAAVEAFHRQGLAANPEAVFTAEKQMNQAAILDLDGNQVQVVCAEPPCTSNVITGRFTLILEPQQAGHKCRVLGWSSQSPRAAEIENAGSKDGTAVQSQSKQPDLAETPAPTQAKIADANVSGDGGISAVFGALIGAATGAAAGAAITYAVMSAKAPTTISVGGDSRPRAIPAGSQRSVASGISTGIAQRDQPRPLSVRSQRMAIEETGSSEPRRSLALPAASIPETQPIQKRSNDIERMDREDTSGQLVRLPTSMDVSRSKQSSMAASSRYAKTEPVKQRLALPPPASSASAANTVAIGDQRSEKELRASPTAKSRRSPSSIGQDDKIADHKKSSSPSSSSPPPRSHHSERRSNERLSAKNASKEELSSSGRSGAGQTGETQRSTTKSAKSSIISARTLSLPSSHGGTSGVHDTVSHVSVRKTDTMDNPVEKDRAEDKCSHVSARNVLLPSSHGGTSDFYDTFSHLSGRKTDASASRVKNSHAEDKRSHVSARNLPLPSSRAGTSDFYDTVSHVSGRKRDKPAVVEGSCVEDKRSHISARNFPLPASCVNTASRVGGLPSHVSARDIPLPASRAGTNYDGDARSHISARNIPLPGSHIGSSHLNWDDDSRSIAPSDSISCIGSK